MRVLIVTGASGGHIFPALALVDSLKAGSSQVLLVLPDKAKKNGITLDSEKIEYIPNVDFTSKLSKKNISGAWFFLLAAWKSLRIIIKFKPDVVVGFGSLNTAALIFWAWLFRINTVIHEQNVVPGRANCLLARLVDKVAVSFIQTSSYLKVSQRKIFLTGNPIRRSLTRLDRKEALDFFGFKEGKINILITGGSQGAHKLNTVCFTALSSFFARNDLQVIHISGSQDFAQVKKAYADSGIACKVFDFFPQMQYAYSIADILICRAGATTIAELQKFCVPAILVPYPFAYAHQLANAQVLENIGAALIINDAQLSVEKLNAELLKFLENPAKLEDMRRAYSRIEPLDAAFLLAEEILDFHG